MANRFWVLDTGTWDSSTTTHWSASSGGLGGASVPGASDTVTFDANSCLLNGTVTVNTAVTVQSITCGALAGTLDFSANNNNVTLSATAGFNGSGTGVRTINLGNGQWILAGAASSWTMTTVTNLTFAANSSTISFTGNTASNRQFTGGGLTYSNLTLSANTSTGLFTITGANTFTNIATTGKTTILFPSATTTTVSSLSLSGSAGGGVTFVRSSTDGSAATISDTSGTNTINWCGIRSMTFSGGATFTAVNSFDLGINTGITIIPPTMTRSRGWSGFP